MMSQVKGGWVSYKSDTFPTTASWGKGVERCREPPLTEDGRTQGHMPSWLTAVGEPALGSVWEGGKKGKTTGRIPVGCLRTRMMSLACFIHDTLQSKRLADWNVFCASQLPVLTSRLLVLLQQPDASFELKRIWFYVELKSLTCQHVSWSTTGEDAGLSLHLKSSRLFSVTTVWAEKKPPRGLGRAREEGQRSWVCLLLRAAVAVLTYIIDRVKNGSKFALQRAGQGAFSFLLSQRLINCNVYAC